MATGQPNSSPKATISSVDWIGSSVPGTDATSRRRGRLPGGDLVAHDLDGLGRRPDPDRAGVGEGAGEVGVLGEEPVAGVHGVGAARATISRMRVGVEVALGGRLPAEGVGLVGVPGVGGVAVELGVDRDAW